MITLRDRPSFLRSTHYDQEWVDGSRYITFHRVLGHTLWISTEKATTPERITVRVSYDVRIGCLMSIREEFTINVNDPDRYERELAALVRDVLFRAAFR
jgi:hypothetical protein